MKNKICEKVLRKEERTKDGFSYTYELTMREGNEVISFRLPLYSIRITMKDTDGKCREAEAKDIFSNYFKAQRFFDKIVRNLATPIDLGYVVEDEVMS